MRVAVEMSNLDRSECPGDVSFELGGGCPNEGAIGREQHGGELGEDRVTLRRNLPDNPPHFGRIFPIFTTIYQK